MNFNFFMACLEIMIWVKKQLDLDFQIQIFVWITNKKLDLYLGKFKSNFIKVKFWILKFILKLENFKIQD